jgi:hypothetical protein
MSERAMLSLVAVVIAGPAAACANPPWQPAAYETAIKRYYEAHASEKNGRCLAPYVDGFTTVQVVEDTPERMVIDARYLYRDWRKDGSDDRPFSECISYGQRSFVLARADDRLEVTEMSGPRRN